MNVWNRCRIAMKPVSKMVDLDTPLLRLSRHDVFRVRDAVQGVCVTGSIGSGKSSGSGKTLAGAYLRAGMGGIVLCAKAGEAEAWRQYARLHGREHSLIEFNGRNGFAFNFLSYELSRLGPSGINSVIECLMRIVEASRMASASPGRGGEHFWEDTTRQLLRNIIPMLYVAYGTVTMADIIRMVRAAPRSTEQLADPAWQGRSFLFQTLGRAADRLGDTHPLIGRTASFWTDEFATWDAKTQGNIAVSLTTVLDRFHSGWLEHAFCGQTTLVPELTFHGAIIVLDMPALTLNEDGIVAQQLFKYMWQRAVLARNDLAPEQRARPVFLWADEAQYFINSYDAEFLSTARDALACPVFLSQSLPTFVARMPGEDARAKVDHLLGNFATKIWHSNACAHTNQWAADTVGRSLQRYRNYSAGEGTNTSLGMNMGEGMNENSSFSSGGSYGGGGYGSNWSAGGGQGYSDNWGRNRGSGSSSNVSHGYSEQMAYIIEPAQFGRMLKTGGPANGNQVSAVWYQAGRRFQVSGGNSMLASFNQ